MANIKIATVRPATIKDRVQFALKNKGVSAFQMEQDLGFAKGYVSKLDKASPSADKLEKIADYLQVSMDWLVSGKGRGYRRNIAHIRGQITKIQKKENENTINKFPEQDVVKISDEAKQFALAYDKAPDDVKQMLQTLLKYSKPAP